MILRMILPMFRIPSVNEMYVPDLNNGGFYLNPEVSYLRDKLRTHLTDCYPRSNFSHLTKTSLVSMDYDFILKKSFYRRDVSNMIKMVEDTITRYIGIDDSQVISVGARKSFIPKNNLEYVAVTIDDASQITEPNFKTDPIVIPVDYLHSVNSMYAINQKSRVEFKKPEVHNSERNVINWIRTKLPKSLIASLADTTKRTMFRCHYDFLLKANSPVRDTSNMIKFIEDAIFRGFRIDDSRVIELEARKFPAANISNEYVSFLIEPSTYDFRSFSTSVT